MLSAERSRAFLERRSFGRRGTIGIVLALLGGVLATLLTGIIGAATTALPTALATRSLSQELIAVGFGALSYPMAAAGAPNAAAIWFAIVAVTHVFAWLMRRKRQP